MNRTKSPESGLGQRPASTRLTSDDIARIIGDPSVDSVTITDYPQSRRRFARRTRPTHTTVGVDDLIPEFINPGSNGFPPSQSPKRPRPRTSLNPIAAVTYHGDRIKQASWWAGSRLLRYGAAIAVTAALAPNVVSAAGHAIRAGVDTVVHFSPPNPPEQPKITGFKDLVPTFVPEVKGEDIKAAIADAGHNVGDLALEDPNSKITDENARLLEYQNGGQPTFQRSGEAEVFYPKADVSKK